MEIKAQDLINKLKENYGKEIAEKDTQIAMLQVQVEELQKQNSQPSQGGDK